jgi:hypothetical protein
MDKVEQILKQLDQALNFPLALEFEKRFQGLTQVAHINPGSSS